MRQVNMSCDVSENITYWTSEWSEDGYRGYLTDTVYEDGVSYTNWCLFAGTEEQCAQFITICEEKGEDEAHAWARNEAHKAFVRQFGEMPRLQ